MIRAVLDTNQLLHKLKMPNAPGSHRRRVKADRCALPAFSCFPSPVSPSPRSSALGAHTLLRLSVPFLNPLFSAPCPLLAASCKLPPAFCQLPAAYCKLPPAALWALPAPPSALGARRSLLDPPIPLDAPARWRYVRPGVPVRRMEVEGTHGCHQQASLAGIRGPSGDYPRGALVLS